jgi:tetratricopeptide (TPR) repeat protein
MTLGRLHAELGRAVEAAADFERTLALIPRTAHDRRHGAHRNNLIREMAAYAEAFALLLERHPEDGSLWTGRGRYYLLRDQWDRAASDFAIAVVSAQPKSEEWDEYAALRLLVGDVAGYRAFVREIIRGEVDTRDPYVGFVLARACNLSPEPVADPDQVVRWAELGTTAGDFLWYKNTLGVALFRAGRYREAIRTLERVVPGVFHSAERKLAMAMAYHRLGEAAKARALLDEVRAMFEKAKKRRVRGAVMVPSTDWAPAHVYLHEAEARILYDPIFPADPFAP